MPDVKVCLWNIQNYGANTEKFNGFGITDRSNALRNRFVARFVQSNAIDVLLIQEASSVPSNALADLCTQLNALYPATDQDWRHSWCGSAIANRNVDIPARPTDLAYRTGARTEGYAVLWRRDQAARFAMIQGLYAIATGTGPNAHLPSPLNMSMRGRPTGDVPVALGAPFFGATGGCMPTVAYPFALQPDGRYAVMDAWPKLNYPPTSKYDRRGVQWDRSRRPVYVVLKLNGTEKLLCPVCAYHAPSSQAAASWGAYIAGLAREIYAINAVDAHDVPVADELIAVRKCVFGGDFNLSVNQANWPGDYKYFTLPYQRNYEGGASRRVAPPATAADEDRRTTVQILGDNHTTPITSPDTDAYLKWKIDLAFFTAATGVSAARIDLLSALINEASGVYRDPLVETGRYLTDAEAQVATSSLAKPRRLATTGPQVEVTKKAKKKTYKKWVAVISGAWGGTFTDWAETKRQFNAGAVTDARRAAEYIHIFISDHLPLVATIPV